MANRPLVLLIRLFLELFGFFAFGYFGWQAGSGFLRFALAALLPLAAASIWGTFRVPNDPGPAPVTVPGWLRLLIEVVFFSSAAIFLFLAGQENAALILGTVFVLLYAVSYDRVVWLLNQKN
jgi:hypothetical protein